MVPSGSVSPSVCCAVGQAFADRDAVSDGDLVGADEDIFDQQPQHALAFFDDGDLGFAVELGEEAFQVGSEREVAVTVGELGVECLDLVAQVGFSGSQVGHSGAHLLDRDQLLAERLDHRGDPGPRFGQCGFEPFALRDSGIGGFGANSRRLSISARMSCGSANIAVIWSQTTASR